MRNILLSSPNSPRGGVGMHLPVLACNRMGHGAGNRLSTRFTASNQGKIILFRMLVSFFHEKS